MFLCDHIAIEDFRREIHTLLNRGESVHQLLQRAVYSGKVAPERGRRRDEERAGIPGPADTRSAGRELTTVVKQPKISP